MKTRKTKNQRMGSIAGTEVDLSSYERTVAASGAPSLDIGDEVAVELRGLELRKVYRRVARAMNAVFGEPIRKSQAEMEERYAHLNAGMQRMQLGNRLRYLNRLSTN